MSVQINGTNGLVFADGSTQKTAANGSFKNRILNGDCRIDQRNAGASVTISASGGYTLDRWATASSQASKFSVQQNAGSITPPSGFRNYLGVTSLSAYTVGASELFLVNQAIEGFNTADLMWGTANAQTVTLSFWVRSSLTGTFGGSIVNGSFNRSYPFSYTISAANTWEQKSITIAGDTSGTWATNNTVGLIVYFGLGSGSTYSGTAGAWSGSLYFSATGATSVVGTNGATFYITGVQLEKGSTATSFDYRPYGTELALCQRYYYQSWGSGVISGVGNAFVGMPIPNSLGNAIGSTTFPVTMRANPTVTLLDDAGATGAASQPGSSNGLSSNSINMGINGFNQISRPSGSYLSGYPVRAHYIATIEL